MYKYHSTTFEQETRSPITYLHLLKAMAPSSKTNTPEKILSLCVKNLPPNMDYDMLKKIIPSAKKLMLRKKSNFMRAFITFSSKEGHKDALHRLKGVEFDGIKMSCINSPDIYQRERERIQNTPKLF
ncbi:unnamed protein product [Heterobilharzia americana]|nr:unnamed protein product [Heterobilharzia americana]